jgi:uncharacterized membrane protein YsdA (DUF1294 family)
MPGYSRRPLRPDWFHGIAALCLTVLFAVFIYLQFAFHLTWFYVLAAWLLAISITTFGYYGFDKYRAGRKTQRVPEVVLHGLALFGGSVAAYTAQQFFRHKTVKSGFRFLFWVIIVAQLLVIGLVLYLIWQHRS